MMSVGHCTQRKPHHWGPPCLVVSLVPKLLAHQIHLLFRTVDVNTAAPWCNGSKERSDCKISWDAAAISRTFAVRKTSQLKLLATGDDPSPLDISGDCDVECPGPLFTVNTLWFFTVVTWLRISHKVHNSKNQQILRYALLLSSGRPLETPSLSS